jgi:NhaA family Na+:H+ antiporter
MPVNAIREFLKLEAAGGLLLIFGAAFALILANSPLSGFYDGLLDIPLAVQVGALEIAKPLLLWINDGLMAVFFFLVGLEIKREIVDGELSSMSQIGLPAVAAIGGMFVPAGIYALLNLGDPVALQGWAIPAATDIAFALGILALLGSRAPLSLKIFLTAVAIIDDLGAIIIIAVFFTTDLSMSSLVAAGTCIVALFVLNLVGVRRLAPYILIGIVLWVAVLKSGVHATLAGVVLAMAIPLTGKTDRDPSPLRHLEHELHPWVAFAILPIFAFANAGVSFAGMSFADLFHPIPLGIIGGLFIGKQIGVFGAVYGMVRLGLAKPPEGASWLQIYAVSLLCGIGFTMSLFIGTLAFTDPEFAAPIRLGVLGGSLLSAVVGFVVLRFAPVRASSAPEVDAEPQEPVIVPPASPERPAS